MFYNTGFMSDPDHLKALMWNFDSDIILWQAIEFKAIVAVGLITEWHLHLSATNTFKRLEEWELFAIKQFEMSSYEKGIIL